MPGDQPRRSGPAWRHESKPAVRPGVAKHAWQKDAPSAAAPTRRWSRKTKFGLLGLGFLLLAGAIAYWVYLIRPPRPPHLVIIESPNAANLRVPHNIAGRRGSDALAQWAGEREQIKTTRVEPAVDGAAWDGWLSECLGSLGQKPAEKVILFVAAHGGADSQGAYLVPHGADPAERGQLLRLTEILDRLRRLPDRTAKLLILDVTQVSAHGPLGLFQNDFVRELKELQPEIERIPNLVVICASDEGQRSWVSEEWGQTIFAHYVIEGLKGAAESRHGRIYADELFASVSRNVRQWARDNRDALQEPVLLGGVERARKMDLVVAGEYREPNPQELPTFRAPAELRAAWEECQQLAKQSPEVFAPHLWRQYLDTLLRYEQLLRLNGREADPLRRQLGLLRDPLAGAGRLKLHSATAALPLATVFEPAPSDREGEELAEAFRRLWDKDAPADEYRQLVQAASPTARPARRLGLLAELYDRAAQGPERNLARACALLPGLDDADGPRPAEVHFMAMLQRDLVPSPDWALVKKALELRRLAEEAALGLKRDDPDSKRLPAYSEQVAPWIKKKVEEADSERQLGEHLVFASEAADWKKSNEHLDRARPLYEDGQAVALAVRRALFSRDRALAALPYYSHWLAGRRTPDEHLERGIALWKQLHELDHLLAQPAADRARLAALTQEVDKGMNALRGEFDRHCRELAEAVNVVLQSRWHEIEDALTVPFIEPGLRVRLLEYSREISHTFNARKGGEGQTMTAEQGRELTRGLARRQARMALAVLGEEWFNAAKGGPDHTAAARLLDHPEDADAFHRAAEQLARRWNRRAIEAQQQTAGARNAEKLEEAAAPLRAAARLARHLDGADALRLAPLNPPDESRRLQVHDLLCWQAERALADHWFSEDPKRPYYRAAGYAYLADAKALAGEGRADLTRPQKTGRLRRAAELDEVLDRPGEFAARWQDGAAFRPGPALVVLTDEERFGRTYRVEAPESVRQGYPVVWVERGRWLRPTSGKDAGRRVLTRIDEQNRADTVTFELASEGRAVSLPARDDTHHTLYGLFRGQRFELRSDVQLHRLPDTVAFQQRMPLGAVAMQGTKELYDRYGPSNTAIAIVLDCSGSMNAVKSNETKRRFDKALDALEEVLKQLPPGVTLSLRVFSQEEDNGASKLLWNPVKWDPRATESYMKQLRRLKPWHDTPLVRAIEQAREDFPRDFKGFKTLVVITDGGDSDKTINPEDIPSILARDFRDTNILINAIGFDMSFKTNREERAAEKFQEAVRKLGGNYYDVKDKDQLVSRLKESMLNLRFGIERHRDGVPPRQLSEEGREIGRVGEDIRWVDQLQPGLYELDVRVLANRNRPLRRTIYVDGGDFLLLNLLPRGDRFVFERDLYAESYGRFGREVKKAEDSSRQWLAAVLQNQHRQDGSLQLMTTIEKTKDRAFEGGTLQQVRPRLALFQVRPQGKDGAPLALRFGNLAGYPAPAWGLDVAGWPRGAAPVFDAWWSDDDLHAVDDDHPYARILKRDVHFDLGANHRPVRAKLGPGEWTDEVVLESVRIERRDVETRPGVVERDLPCLVVRLRHPAGKPFLVQVRRTVGQEQRFFTGHEHRFYSAANKYTGVFWGWTEEELRKELNLELISVEGFKKAASHVRLEPGQPDTRARPQPVNVPLEYERR